MRNNVYVLMDFIGKTFNAINVHLNAKHVAINLNVYPVILEFKDFLKIINVNVELIILKMKMSNVNHATLTLAKLQKIACI